MRKVAVVGAGQAGLHLAIALVDRGYDVTMMAERSAEEILASPATGISALFGETLDLEESLGLNLWDDVLPPLDGMHLTFAGIDSSARN
jgi:2-polyprenyl-6-methoxyphenol hydroxylase-like FAD-dependent oxidoreductase